MVNTYARPLNSRPHVWEKDGGLTSSSGMLHIGLFWHIHIGLFSEYGKYIYTTVELEAESVRERWWPNVMFRHVAPNDCTATCTHPYMCVMTRDSFTCAPWLKYMRARTYLYICFTQWLHCHLHTTMYVCHDSWPIHMCAMTHLYTRQNIFIHMLHPMAALPPAHTHVCVSWPMTHSRVRHDSFTCAPEHIYTCAAPNACTVPVHKHVCVSWPMTYLHVRYDSFICAQEHICTYVAPNGCAVTCPQTCMCVMTHDLFTHASWLIYLCTGTHLYMWCTQWLHTATCTNVFHDLFIRVPWLIHMCAMTHAYVCHDSFICVQSYVYMRECVCACVWRCVTMYACIRCVYACVRMLVCVCLCVCMFVSLQHNH